MEEEKKEIKLAEQILPSEKKETRTLQEEEFNLMIEATRITNDRVNRALNILQKNDIIRYENPILSFIGRNFMSIAFTSIFIKQVLEDVCTQKREFELVNRLYETRNKSILERWGVYKTDPPKNNINWLNTLIRCFGSSLILHALDH